jgi:hypothetical protein
MKLLILIGVATLSNDRGSPWRVLTLVAGILEEILGRMMRLKDLGEIQRNREEQKVSERCVQCVLEKKRFKAEFLKAKRQHIFQLFWKEPQRTFTWNCPKLSFWGTVF